MNSIEEIAVAWIAGWQDDFESVAIRFVDTAESSIRFQVNQSIIQVIIPSSFQLDGCSSSAIASSGEVFLVTGVGCEVDEDFDNMILALNEKLERIAIQPGSLSHVLDHLLLALQKYDRIKSSVRGKAKSRALGSGSCYSAVSDNASDCVDDDLMIEKFEYGIGESTTENQQLSSGFLYVMAENARSQCESAQWAIIKNELISDSFEDNVCLAWCHVISEKKMFTVNLVINVGGIVHDDNLASALGISLDFPVKISLLFEKKLWLQRVKTLVNPLQVRCKVTQEISLNSNDFSGMSNESSHSMSYGKEVLLPKLVGSFFQFLYNGNIVSEEKPRSQQFFDELHEFCSMENMFTGLLCFLCARLKTLRDWCIVCLSSLPYSVCRLQTCDRDLCLFTFEEVGVGAPVLQEAQLFPEIVDFQLSLAIVAADSKRDVFEPFPSFLLQKEQLRGRSGWFSKTQKVESSRSVQFAAQVQFSSNKNLALLKAVLASIPSIEVLQKCRDEVTLRDTLNSAWDKKLGIDRKSKRPEAEKSSHLDELKSLPFRMLRYILCTSRLQLRRLQNDDSFHFFDSHYQFVVLHDSPEREAYFESQRLEKGGSFFAFHGSSSDNWYSILRNGLRCLSHTSFMSGGVSFGPGIYLSRFSNTSMHFCKNDGLGSVHGPLKDGFSVLAICEIINGSFASEPGGTSNGMRERGIVVVPPEYEKDVAIRYIIVLRGWGWVQNSEVHIDGTKMADDIDLTKHYFSQRLSYSLQQQEQGRARFLKHFEHMLNVSEQRMQQEDLKNQSTRGGAKDAAKQVDQADKRSFLPVPISKKPVSSTGVSSISIQAIAREYKTIMRQTNEAKAMSGESRDEGFRLLAGLEVILPDETNIRLWHVNLSQFLFKQFPLYKDLVECARQWNVPEVSIKLECTFPENYPFLPPFVRVISPKFSFHTGHVTVGGSICMELLTASGWSPANTFESVMIQIVNAIVEGGGRLDKRAMHTRSEYNEFEAREAFNRVAREHGWKVY